MKNTEQNFIHIQLTGDKAHPENIPFPKLVSIIESYIKLIGSFNVFMLNGEEFSLSEFSLTNINACCTDISLAVESKKQVYANDFMIDTFSQDRKTELPFEIKKNANMLNHELIEQDLALKLFTNAGVDVAYEPKIFDVEDIIIEERRTIYGKMNNIGGKTPNFHLEDHTGKEFVVGGINEQVASELANRLYKNIGVIVDCKIHSISMEMESHCKFIHLLPYDDRNWFEESAKFINKFPSIFPSTEEMHKKLSEIRGKE